MSEKKELNLEELEKVSGGITVPDELISKIIFIKQINIYETAYHKGEEVGVATSDNKIDYTGTLKDSWEGKHNRYIKILVKYSKKTSEIGTEKDIALNNDGDPNKYENCGESRVWLISYK